MTRASFHLSMPQHKQCSMQGMPLSRMLNHCFQRSGPRTREILLQGLAERGFEETKLQALKALCDAEDSDIYDVLRYIAYARDTMTRTERAGILREYYLEQLDENEREFVSFILDLYEQRGEGELQMKNLTGLVKLHYRTMRDATGVLGSAKEIAEDYLDMQRELYAAVS
jgi:type I restriction enzyme R subunit